MERNVLLFPLNENMRIFIFYMEKRASAGPAASIKTYQSASADTRG